MSNSVSKFNRRSFFGLTLLGTLGLSISALGIRRLTSNSYSKIRGNMLGANYSAGHILRQGLNTIPAKEKAIDTVIVGAGISGLSAGWWLKKKGADNFILLELDRNPGGNSVSGENEVSKYPWGAHYLPIPGNDAVFVREFLEEIGVITGYKNGLAVYNDYYICNDPTERLYFKGRWQEGIIPSNGLSLEEKESIATFFAHVEKLKHSFGSDNKRVFSIPLDLSSQDPEFLKLDKISMLDYLNANNWGGEYLKWYVDYCCKDDYGQGVDKVSAWAGLHYFCSRSGIAANAESHNVLTWPEGNGFLVNNFKAILKDHIHTDSLVYKIQKNEDSTYSVDVTNPQTRDTVRYKAKNVIFSSPRFVADRVIKGYKRDFKLEHAPWLVANITLKNMNYPKQGEFYWDNVSYYSKSLGYIYANHQELKQKNSDAVLTYFYPINDLSPLQDRISAFSKDTTYWKQLVLNDMLKIQPEIEPFIHQVDVWLWGHGMISPSIDYLWGQKRKSMQEDFEGIVFAHSDMSGVSIFEEAQYRGVMAAKKILNRRGNQFV